MDRIVVSGGPRLSGEVSASGSKNSCLALLAASILAEGPTGLLDAMVHAGLANSRGAARKLVQSKGVRVNGVVQDDVERSLDWGDALFDRFYLLPLPGDGDHAELGDDLGRVDFAVHCGRSSQGLRLLMLVSGRVDPEGIAAVRVGASPLGLPFGVGWLTGCAPAGRFLFARPD